MIRKMIIPIASVILVTIAGSCPGCSSEKSACNAVETQNSDPVDKILDQLTKATENLRTYQADIEHSITQPLFESKTLRKGTLYYQKQNEKAFLRINLRSIKQDDEKETEYIEQYFFNGLQLTVVDYQNKHAKRYQLSEPNEPVDVFEKISENFPIIGFSKTQKLKEQFQITLVEKTDKNHLAHLSLKPLKNSPYGDDYASIDFWIDKNTKLPVKILAFTTQEDIYLIRFLKASVNKAIDKDIFICNIPKGFSIEEKPLEKKNERTEK